MKLHELKLHETDILKYLEDDNRWCWMFMVNRLIYQSFLESFKGK